MASQSPKTFEHGKTYLVTHRGDGQKYDRQSVMVYLDRQSAYGRVDHRFSARPAAGTQTMPEPWIVAAEEVADGTECYVNRRKSSPVKPS